MATSKPSELSFREATLDDVTAMVSVLEAAFSRWPDFEIEVTAAEHLRWKMCPPGDLMAASVVGLVDGAIVTVATRWAAMATLGGEDCAVDSGADLAIPPEMQGRGYGRQLAAHLREMPRPTSRLGLRTVSKNDRVSLIYRRAPGDDRPRLECEMGVWVRTNDLTAFAATHLRGGGAAHLGTAMGRSAVRSMRERPSSSVEVSPIGRFGASVDSLWEAVAPTFDFAVKRQAEFLNWRYRDPRAGDSTVLGTFDGDRLTGYAVFKRAGDWANVLDLVTDPDYPDVGAALLNAGWEAMREAGSRGLSCWLAPKHRDEAALHAAGFFDDGRGTTVSMTWTSNSDAFAVVQQDGARLHISLGDFDFV